MDFTYYFYIGAFISTISSASGTRCAIKDRKYCSYTVVCEGHAGEALSPPCRSDAYVSFIMRDSNVDTLTAGFFKSTNFNPRVRYIEAINNNWTNIESFALKYYTKCLEMNLANNNIVNIKNDAFRNLLALDFLNLSMNAIESLNPSSFEIAEQSGGKLEKLDLSYNLLTEISSEPLAYLTNLKFLYLQNNRLTTLANDCFTHLIKLTTLNLRNNRLTAINMTLLNLNSLQRLDISFNFLKKIAGLEFNRAGALLLVNMSYNHIEEVELNCFHQAFNLIALDLSNNRIKTPIYDVIFINNKRLQHLNLYNNSIQYINDDAFKHNDLNYLNLERNYLTGDISKNAFSGLSNVTRLDLFNQSINAIKQGAFTAMVNLIYLNLSHNYIDSLENDSFSISSPLNILDISHNKIYNLDFLKGCLVNLAELYLNDNKLISIKNDTFVNQINLKKLDLSMNFIVTLSLPFNKENDLVDVNLSNNSINFINAFFFQNMDHLQSLDLSNNKISELQPGIFLNLKILKLLNLSSNSIKKIRYGSFRGLNRTEVIDLSRNEMNDLDVDIFHVCVGLKRLIIDYNFITQVDFDRLVMTAPNLNALSLGGNPIMCKEIIRNYNKGFVSRVEVTSIDKFFAKDNVHGIWCGGPAAPTPTELKQVSPTEREVSESTSLPSLLLIWCTVLTILVLVIGVGSYIYKRKRILVISGSS